MGYTGLNRVRWNRVKQGFQQGTLDQGWLGYVGTGSHRVQESTSTGLNGVRRLEANTEPALERGGRPMVPLLEGNVTLERARLAQGLQRRHTRGPSLGNQVVKPFEERVAYRR